MRIMVGQYAFEVTRNGVTSDPKAAGDFILGQSSMGQPKYLVDCRGVESDHVSKPLVKFRRRIDV